MRLVVASGYVEIPGHPRTKAVYDELGAQLMRIQTAPVHVCRTELADCWLTPYVRDRHVKHAVAGNPSKNSMAYHVVQHQKSAWLIEVAAATNADVIVWLDYGVCHQPGVTTDAIEAFLQRAQTHTGSIALPGAWESAERTPFEPNWRFLGSSFVAPRALIERFHAAVQAVTLERLERGLVTWEINDWADVERRGNVPMRWYQANHNRSQFDQFVPESV